MTSATVVLRDGTSQTYAPVESCDHGEHYVSLYEDRKFRKGVVTYNRDVVAYVTFKEDD